MAPSFSRTRSSAMDCAKSAAIISARPSRNSRTAGERERGRRLVDTSVHARISFLRNKLKRRLSRAERDPLLPQTHTHVGSRRLFIERSSGEVLKSPEGCLSSARLGPGELSFPSFSPRTGRREGKPPDGKSC